MLKKYFVLYFSFFIFHFSFSQGYNPDKVNKHVGDIYAQALQKASAEQYNDAIVLLNKCVEMDAKMVDAYLSLGGIYNQIKKYPAAIKSYENAMELDSVYSFEYHLPYSISLAGNGEFEKALQAVNVFLSSTKLNQESIKSAEYRKQTYLFAIDYAKKHSLSNYVFAPKNLGDSINTKDLEYYPSLSLDGKKMVFTRRVNNDEDFYESDWVNGAWSKARPLEGKVNTNFNEGAQTVSVDGEMMIFTGCNYPEGLGSCDLYIAYKTKNGWSEPENLGPPVNTEYLETSPTLSPDKKDLYFSSDRPGGYGGRDIWVSHHLSNGQWGEPENMGPTINTVGNEGCPFMYPDNQTLFFNSNGHAGYGQSDLFFSKKINDSTWGSPENLGYPINTIDEEGSLIVAADGKTAYFTSDRFDTRGGLDIYSFELRQDIRPPKTLWVKGKVYDAKTKTGLPSMVELTDIKSHISISKLQTDETGQYLTTLPVGGDYAFNVNRKGYLFYSENYNLTDSLNDSSFTADIPLQPLNAGVGLVLKNIFFDTKKFDLKPESLPELDKIIQLMTDNPDLKILISGHTDNVGNDENNKKLSEDRALAVVRYLLASRKISKERLQYKGFGATRPVADNATDAGRAQNRRTELTVISN